MSTEGKCIVCKTGSAYGKFYCERCSNTLVSVYKQKRLADAIKEEPASIPDFHRQIQEHPDGMILVDRKEYEQMKECSYNEEDAKIFGLLCEQSYQSLKDTLEFQSPDKHQKLYYAFQEDGYMKARYTDEDDLLHRLNGNVVSICPEIYEKDRTYLMRLGKKVLHRTRIMK